jgi:hypothetical protein
MSHATRPAIMAPLENPVTATRVTSTLARLAISSISTRKNATSSVTIPACIGSMPTRPSFQLPPTASG